MLKINKGEFGTVYIGKDVISRLVIERMQSMEDFMLPCNKKGKIAGKKKGFLQSDDYENAVEIRVNSSNELSIKLYFIARFGESINQMANELFDGIEADLELYGINKPVFITANVKGVLAKQIVERNVEVSRYNG